MVKLKNLFSFSFGFTIIIRALSIHDLSVVLPCTELYVLFIVLWGFLAIRDGCGSVSVLVHSDGTKVSSLLVIYFIIWGLSNIQALDFTDTVANMMRSLLMMSFIIISSYWIRRLRCLYSAIRSAYISLTVLLWVMLIAYINQINLVRTIATFWISEEWLRTRCKFGFMNNIAAEYALSVILMSAFWLAEARKTGNLKSGKKWLMYFNNLVMVVIIVANNSRGTAVAMVVMAVVYILIKGAGRYGVLKMIKGAVSAVVVIVIIFAVGVVQGNIDINQLLEGTNRSHFLSNIDALAASGRWLMGLGNISGLYFAERHVLYGVQLNFMEVGYIGFFVCSGIIGCLLLAYVVILILRSIMKYIRVGDITLGKWMLTVFAYMLFLNLFEGYLFSFLYITSSVFLCFIVSYIDINYENSKYEGRKFRLNVPRKEC